MIQELPVGASERRRRKGHDGRRDVTIDIELRGLVCHRVTPRGTRTLLDYGRRSVEVSMNDSATEQCGDSRANRFEHPCLNFAWESARGEFVRREQGSS